MFLARATSRVLLSRVEIARCITNTNSNVRSYSAVSDEDKAGEAVSKQSAVSSVVSGAQPSSKLMQSLVDARVHLGHKAGVWNQKMAPYILGTRAGIHIIDLDETVFALQKALKVIRQTVAADGSILFVNTRSQFEVITRRAATACGEYFVTKKWIGGTLTNSGEVFGINRRPDVIIVLSVPVARAALREADQVCIPTIGIVDTDCDPDSLTIPIPGNDDSEEAIKLYLDYICSTIISVKEQKQKTFADPQQGKHAERRNFPDRRRNETNYQNRRR
eukprot:m.256315 g.256315  ORF g.256315 m.256315 type:complete len:276 (-) comp19630_c0_seq1:91-918(-)